MKTIFDQLSDMNWQGIARDALIVGAFLAALTIMLCWSGDGA